MKTENLIDTLMEVQTLAIADFIGEKLYTREQLKDIGCIQQWKFPFCDGYYPTLDTMKFHTSWDWLMPAFGKFSSLDVETDSHVQHVVAISEKILECDIHCACERLAEAIKWYNSQKK